MSGFNPTWRQLLDEGTEILIKAGIQEAELDAWHLMTAVFPIDRVHFLMDRDRRIHDEQFKNGYAPYKELLKKRASRIPLQQLLGVQEFMGLEFKVNEHVLIPRQDTETLVEAVLKSHQDTECSVLDMCTGSGCIAISLALKGGYRKVAAADLSLAALKVAKKNAFSLFLCQKGVIKAEVKRVSEQPWQVDHIVNIAGPSKENPGILVTKQLKLIESDLFSNIDPEEFYDIIVSNPPYIPSSDIEGLEPEVKGHEPRMALDGRGDGLHFYKILAEQCGFHLKGGGRIYFEIGCDQASAVTGLLAQNGFEQIQVIKDAPGLDRVVTAVWNKHRV